MGSVESNISEHPLRFYALFLQQTGETPPGPLGVAAGLHDFGEHVAVLIDSAPEPASCLIR
jgi:hypothetical protein